MIEIIILIVGIFVLSGIFWHSIFFSKDNRLKIGGIFQVNVHTARILGAHIIKNDALI